MNISVKRGRWALLGLPAVFLLAFVVVPLLMVLYMGFSREGGISLATFLDIFGSGYYRGVMLFSFEQALASVLVTLVLGLPGAYILSHYDFRGKDQVLALSTVPFVLPSVLVVLGFVIFFGNTGILNDFLRDTFNVGGVPFRILYSWKAIILAHAFYNIPLVFRYVSSIWANIDDSLLEAARNLGASRLRTLRDIELPYLSQAILSCSLLVFIYSFTSFAIVLALGGARYTTMEVTIYTVTNLYGSFELAGALSILQMAFLLIVVFLYYRTDRGHSVGGRKTKRALSSMSLTHKSMTALYAFVVSVLLMGPILSILYSSIRTRTGGVAGYTLEWFREIFERGTESFIGASPLESIGNSLFIALFAMVISVTFAILLSYYGVNRRGGRVTGILVMVPLCISTITLALGYVFIGNRISIDISLLAIILIHSVISFPLSFRAISNSLSKVDPALIEASQNIGASRFRTFLSIDLPLIRGGIIAAGVLSFAISLGELAAAYMLYGGRYTTIPIHIYRFIGGYRFGPAAALGVMLMAVSAIGFLMIDRAGAKIRF
ncbi:MAG TPA: iron ABC transporter permease [Candidatus Methanofastidiosa archaeon]|nr:iron ABC transporter permease [Candidatus Methanofastidiosa archaeon]HPR41177.1 iron ABC transporter permease [Candidatus Methanofastidiosa archaeon]